jgi:hypothetical protein
VLSKHVKPHKGELARVRALASQGPTQYSYTIYRGSSTAGEAVFLSSSTTALSGEQELTWNGLNSAGQRVANGSYIMQVTAQAFGRATTGTAHIVVNFQGGTQGARLLWQLASPVQRLLSPGDALRVAFPIPCLGAELAGNYLFSPEQLSFTSIGLSN